MKIFQNVVNVRRNILKFRNRLACGVLLLTFSDKPKLKVTFRDNISFSFCTDKFCLHADAIGHAMSPLT